MKLIETLLTGLLRLPGLGAGAERLLEALHRTTARAMRRARRNWVRPREWSNAELRRFAPLFNGPVINVSGWRDEDKVGGHYREYFSAASSYVVSNFSGSRGMADGIGDLFLDLEGECPLEHAGRFQVAYNHTTLEHVYRIEQAVANICNLSHDAVILVTPFLQAVHFEEGSYGDFWRPTPACLVRMLAAHGYTTVYQSTNDNPWYIVYVFTVAVRNPALYHGKLPAWTPPHAGLRHFQMD